MSTQSIPLGMSDHLLVSQCFQTLSVTSQRACINLLFSCPDPSPVLSVPPTRDPVSSCWDCCWCIILLPLWSGTVTVCLSGRRYSPIQMSTSRVTHRLVCICVHTDAQLLIVLLSSSENYACIQGDAGSWLLQPFSYEQVSLVTFDVSDKNDLDYMTMV